MTKVPDHKFWIQLGDDIVGGTSVGPQNAGLSMDLSKDGFTLASGQPLGDIDHIVNGSMHHSRRGQNGKVFIYKYTTPGSTGGTWKEVNATSEITYIGNNRAANGAGEAPSAAGTITGDWYDQLGSSVSMSDDASIIAVTSSHFDPFADGNSTRRNNSQTNFGKVSVYKYLSPANCYVKLGNDIIEYDRHRIEGLKYSWDFRNMGAISSIDEISGVKASTVNYINKQQSTGSNDYFGVEPLPGSSNYKIETGYDIYMSGEVSIEMYLYVTYHSTPATHDIITILDTNNDGFRFENNAIQYAEIQTNQDSPYQAPTYSGNTSNKKWSAHMSNAQSLGTTAAEYHPSLPFSNLITAQTWTHIVFVFDDEGAKVYKNGVPHTASGYSSSQTFQGGANVSNVARKLVIGSSAGNHVSVWPGYLRIYDRAISGNDVYKLHTNMNPGTDQSPNHNDGWDPKLAVGFFYNFRSSPTTGQHFIDRQFGKGLNVSGDGKTITATGICKDYVQNFELDISGNYSSTVSGNIEIMNDSSTLNVVNSGGNKYTFNGNSSYVQYYGMTNGYYTMNIPQNYPIAFVPTNTTFKPVGNTIAGFKVNRVIGSGFGSAVGHGIYDGNFGNVELFSSSTISLNQNGTIIAIGTPRLFNNIGGIVVFRLIGGSWIQLGGLITHANNVSWTGWSVSLNNKGDILAGGAPRYSTYRGRAAVWKYSNSDMSPGGTWSCIANYVDGLNLPGPSSQNVLSLNDTYFGYQVRINDVGNRLFSTQPRFHGRIKTDGDYTNNAPNGNGWIYTFDYSNADMSSGGSWSITGYFTPGIASDPGENGRAGMDIGINSTGTLAVIGLPNINNGVGRIEVWRYSNPTGNPWERWTLLYGLNRPDPATIGVSGTFNRFGASVKMNGDGTIIAVGNNNTPYGSWKASIIFYKWSNGTDFTSGTYNLMTSLGSIESLGSSSSPYVFYSIDSTGYKLVIGNANDSLISSDNSNMGTVRYYTYSTPGTNGGTFNQGTLEFNGIDDDHSRQQDANFGHGVQISKDGSTISASSPYSKFKPSLKPMFGHECGFVKVVSNRHILYSGLESKKYTSQVNGTNYDFYYGDISFNIHADFDNLSTYFYNSNNPVSYGSNMIRYYHNKSIWKNKSKNIHNDFLVHNAYPAGETDYDSTSNATHGINGGFTDGRNSKRIAAFGSSTTSLDNTKTIASDTSGSIVNIGCPLHHGSLAGSNNQLKFPGAIHSYSYRKITQEEWNSQEILKHVEMSPRHKAKYDWDFRVTTPSSGVILDRVNNAQAFYRNNITSSSKGAIVNTTNKHIELERLQFAGVTGSYSFEYYFRISEGTPVTSGNGAFDGPFFNFCNNFDGEVKMYVKNTNLAVAFENNTTAPGNNFTGMGINTNRDADIGYYWKPEEDIHIVYMTHYIPGTTDSNSRVLSKYYINGNLFYSSRYYDPGVKATHNRTLGLNIGSGNTGHAWKGRIYSARVWDYALSEGEIKGLYKERDVIQVKQYSDIANDFFWIKRTANIYGERTRQKLGSSVCCSDDGKIILGGCYSQYTLHNYYYNGSANSTNSWTATTGTLPYKEILRVVSTRDLHYFGVDSAKYTKQVNDISYNFYYGDVTLYVGNNFDYASLYCYHHGYMGGQNMLRYYDASWSQVGKTLGGVENDLFLSTGADQTFGESITFDQSGELISIKDSSRYFTSKTSFYSRNGSINNYKFRQVTEDEWNNSNKLENAERTSLALQRLLSIPQNKRYNWDFRVDETSAVNDSWNSVPISFGTGIFCTQENGVRMTDSGPASAGGVTSTVDIGQISFGGTFTIEYYFSLWERGPTNTTITEAFYATSTWLYSNHRFLRFIENDRKYSIEIQLNVVSNVPVISANFGNDSSEHTGLYSSSNVYNTRNIDAQQHVVLTVNGTLATLYVNGKYENSTQIKNAIPYGARGTTFKGWGGSNYGNFFTGDVHSLRIWQDYEAPLQDVETLYANRDSTYFKSLLASTYKTTMMNNIIIANNDRDKSYNQIQNKKFWISHGNRIQKKLINIDRQYEGAAGEARYISTGGNRTMTNTISMNKKGTIFAYGNQASNVTPQGEVSDDSADSKRGAIQVITTEPIVYNGDFDKKTTKYITGTMNDGSYNFFYGDLQIGVLNDFNIGSVYCYNHGYMGGQNMLRYGNTSWSQLGGDISGNNEVGETVKISGRGDFIASGNHRYSSEKGGLFFYQLLNGTWNKTPNSLDGIGLGLGKLGISDYGYNSMDINEYGTMAIIGHRINSSNGGRIWVVTLDHTINSFVQQPIPIIDASTCCSTNSWY